MSITNKNLPDISHFLGIDYGESKIGLALADSETRIAHAFITLENDKNLFQKLAEIITEKNVIKIIIGLPSYINKESIEYSQEKFGKIIEGKIGLPVEYQDEMFTTKIAQKNLIEKGIKGIKKHDDEEAARIILQEWLDK